MHRRHLIWLYRVSHGECSDSVMAAQGGVILNRMSVNAGIICALSNVFLVNDRFVPT